MKKSMTYSTLLNLSILAVVAGVMLGGLFSVGMGWPLPKVWSAQVFADNIGNDIGFAAINPGYAIGGASNVGEVIVLKRGGDEVLLTGLSIRYTNSSGNSSLLLAFPDGAVMTGETMQLRLASDSGGADLRYTKTIAMSGALELIRGEEVVDRICWNGGEGCMAKFNSAKPTTLVRGEDGNWAHVADYMVEYDVAGVKMPEPEPAEDVAAVSRCAGLEFSEVLSYYESDKREQFVELYNASAEQMVVDGCAVSYKGKNYGITGVVPAAGYLVVYPEVLGFALTKNPNSSNRLELVDTTGEVIDVLTYYNGQKKGVALAQFGYSGGAEQWLATYMPTPGYENDYQKFKTCEAGKVINEETGNCVKDSTLDTTLEACPEGKYRNPLTGRCKSYESDDEPAPCAEGYERNPETGRCRKIKTNTGADWGLEEVSGREETNFVAFGAIGAVMAVGAGYGVWQWRGEIGKGVKRILRKIKGMKGGDDK